MKSKYVNTVGDGSHQSCNGWRRLFKQDVDSSQGGQVRDDGIRLKLIVGTAVKNILGAGRRTWLNVAVLSITFVIMVAYNGLNDGWQKEAYHDTIQWEVAGGQLWHSQYDPLDVFTLQDAHGVIPSDFQPLVENGSMAPVLVTQAAIYPNGRFQNVLLKGIDSNQQLLLLPTQLLQQEEGEIYAIVGKRMAKEMDIEVGSQVMVRWRDQQGTFDAQYVTVAGVFDSHVPNVDNNQLWINIETLQQITNMHNQATYFVLAEQCPVKQNAEGWVYKNVEVLTADLQAILESNRMESKVIFGILLAIAMLAVFDTQTLAIFKRQKEIGTYIALGLTPKQVTALFTVEGTTFSVLAISVAMIWGTPILWWFAMTGFEMPAIGMGTVVGDTLKPYYEIHAIINAAATIVVLSALVSFVPARKIAKQNIVNSLKGKL